MIKTFEQRADEIIDEHETTCMGHWGSRYDEPNHVRGVRVGRLRQLIEDQLHSAVADADRQWIEALKIIEKREGWKLISVCEEVDNLRGLKT